MEINTNQSADALAYRKAKTRVKNLKVFYFMLLGYGLIVLVYFIQKGAVPFFSIGPFLNGWLLTLWGVFIAIYGLYLYIPFFRNWEERQLDKELERIERTSKRQNP